MRGRTLFIGAFAVLTLGRSTVAQASARPASPHATVSQQVGGTLITIDYNRPVARGRLLFGGIVPWGKLWDPGADSATRITVSTDVTVNGKLLSAGEYSLWAMPDPTAWTVILSRASHVYHTPYPTGQDALRFSVAPRQGPFMETLGFYFPTVDGAVATLYLHWGTTIISLTIHGTP